MFLQYYQINEQLVFIDIYLYLTTLDTFNQDIHKQVWTEIRDFNLGLCRKFTCIHKRNTRVLYVKNYQQETQILFVVSTATTIVVRFV